MKRGLLRILPLVVALLALASISIVLAAPRRLPQLQQSETEPNDGFDQADSFENILTGVISGSNDVDTFQTGTEVGRKYEATLFVTDQTGAGKLNMKVYNSDRDEGFIGQDQSSVTWDAWDSTYYVRIDAVGVVTAPVSYRVEVYAYGATPTPTDTPAPTDTPTPTRTPRPTDEDEYEPNDSFKQADAEGPTLPIQVPILLELTFHSVDDADYFRFYTKEDRWYQATTSDLNLIDTLVEIYDADQKRVERDDDGAGGLASQASWKADYDGYYYIVVQNNVDSSGSYNLTMDEISAPPTSVPRTPAPGPTPRSDADDCEDNLDFENACVIPVNETRTFNFVPVFGTGPDNDFYKIWVKPDLHFRCETSDLSPGVDPNMIMFTGPSWDEAIGGNDDISPCNYNSALNYYSTYAGWLYVLVGTGDRTPSDLLDSTYSLRCEKSTAAFSATATPRATATPDTSDDEPPAEPTATPKATPTTVQSPVATPTPENRDLSIRPLTTPTPPATAAPRFVPVGLLVYYDANGDGEPGAGEGITGISAEAYEVATNELLAQGYSDMQGNLEFTVAAQGPVRIRIPFLGFNHLVTGAEASLQVRVPPHSLPGGTP